jgi:hypothetical protein
MNREDIIRMAQEAGFESNSLGVTYTSGWLPDLLERFAALVAAAEREACAKVCDERKLPRLPDSSEFDHLYNQAVSHCAKAIRARGQG